MAHIAFFILPVPGHVNPTLGVAEELVARGHRVTYALPEDIAERAVRVGAKVVEYPMDKERFRTHMVPQQNSDEYTDKDEILRVLEWLLDMTRQTVAPLERHFTGDRPDVIVHDPSSFWVGRILADRWGIPAIRSTPTYAANEHWSMQPDAEAAGPPDEPALRDLVAGIDGLLREQGSRTTRPPSPGASTAVRRCSTCRGTSSTPGTPSTTSTTSSDPAHPGPPSTAHGSHLATAGRS